MGIIVDILQLAYRNAVLWTKVTGTDEIDTLQQSATGRLLVDTSGSSPPVPAHFDLANHSFVAVGGATTYDTVGAVDVDEVRAFGMWVQNFTGTNPILDVSMRLYSAVAGGGIFSATLLYPVPPIFSINQFLCAPTRNTLITWVFDHGLPTMDNLFRSVEFGVRLGAGANQNLVVNYVGVR